MSKQSVLTNFVKKLLQSYESIELSAKPKSYFYAVDIEQALERLKKTNIKSVIPEIKELDERHIDQIASSLFFPGTSLPKLKIDEVEIARIEVSTVLGLAYSLRAEWDDVIKYRLVSEIEDLDFELPIRKSDEPLTLKDVILQFEAASPPVGLTDVMHAFEEDDPDVLSAQSAYYTGFGQFYRYASAKVIKKFGPKR